MEEGVEEESGGNRSGMVKSEESGSYARLETETTIIAIKLGCWLEIIDGCGGKKCNVKSYETLSLIFVWNCEEVTLCGKRHGTRDTGVIFFLDS